MLPFGVTIPATVPQGSEIPEGLMNNPVLRNEEIMPQTFRKRPSVLRFSKENALFFITSFPQARYVYRASQFLSTHIASIGQKLQLLNSLLYHFFVPWMTYSKVKDALNSMGTSCAFVKPRVLSACSPVRRTV
jgi:hypothetical protein